MRRPPGPSSGCGYRAPALRRDARPSVASEWVSLPLHDQHRDIHVVEFVQTASRVRAPGRVQWEREAKHRDGTGRLRCAAGDAGPQGSATDEERQAAQFPGEQVLDRCRPSDVELSRRRGAPATRDPVGLLNQRHAQPCRQSNLAHRHQVFRSHAAPSPVAEGQGGARLSRGIHVGSRQTVRRLQLERRHTGIVTTHAFRCPATATAARAGSRSSRPTDDADRSGSFFNGSDGTRTRDLRRDSSAPRLAVDLHWSPLPHRADLLHPPHRRQLPLVVAAAFQRRSIAVSVAYHSLYLPRYLVHFSDGGAGMRDYDHELVAAGDPRRRERASTWSSG